jgi:hypothetical protein
MFLCHLKLIVKFQVDNQISGAKPEIIQVCIIKKPLTGLNHFHC